MTDHPHTIAEVRSLIEKARDILKTCSDDARVDAIRILTEAYCQHCGDDRGFRCHCMNDE